MQQMPTFGAIPSAADVKKSQDEAADAADKRDEILSQLMQKPAFQRLEEFASFEAEKAERLKNQILAQRAHWRINPPMTEAQLMEMIEQLQNEGADGGAGGRGVVLDRRRFGDDSDSSEIDLSEL